MTEETGTLAELNVKPGDEVECVENEYSDHIGLKLIIRDDGAAVIQSGKYNGCTLSTSLDVIYGRKYRLVSRATPKTWGEMTDAEKGALLLAEHRGEVIEWTRSPGDTEFLQDSATGLEPVWCGRHAYRVRPPEPKRETVAIEGYVTSNDDYVSSGTTGATHRITFDVIDGKPDCASIRMEELW